MNQSDSRPGSCARIVISAPQGRSGKTTISLGICAALSGRGLEVQAFKKGPDYIDPSWLSEASGRPCRSLDPFFLPEPSALLEAFTKGARRADFCLIEGNHGLYDSLEMDGSGSTAAVARALKTPVILVLNAARMGRSAAAMVHGYQSFEPDTAIAAVILNQVAQGRHETKLRQAIESHCQIPVIGAVPRAETLNIPDRHLGLVPRAEDQALAPAIQACREAAEQFIDLDALLEIAHQAPALPYSPRGDESTPQVKGERSGAATVRIGVVRDRAFTFYYPENLEALQEAGAELVFIDALTDPELPTIDGLYIGGGFPEIFLEQLSANHSFRRSLRQAIEADLPVHAECGGLMYLTERIRWGDRSAEMVGIFPLEVEMTDSPQGHGYVLAECTGENPFFSFGTFLRGHEFHHSRVVRLDASWSPVLQLLRGNGLGGKRDGLVYKNVLACYTHLHAGGAPTWASSLVRRAAGSGAAAALNAAQTGELTPAQIGIVE